jgi:hypothetical protein
MRISLLAIPLLLALPLALHSETENQMPVMTAVDPAEGNSGDVLTAQGANLGEDIVAAVFLTDGKTDFKTVIVEQTATSIKFKIPAKAKPGRFALMVLTKGKTSTLIEEPVKVNVEPPASRPAS